MPHINKLVAKDGLVVVTSLEDFPRVESSKVVKDSGVIEFDVPKGVSVLTVDASGKVVTAEVTKFSIHPDLDARTVKFSDDNALLVSSDHSLVAYDDETGAIVKVKPDEAVGKMCPKINNTEGFGDLNEIPLTDYSGNSAASKIPERIELTEELGHFIGIMTGDGWTSVDLRKGRDAFICLASVDSGIQKAFKETIDNIFGEDKKVCTITTQHKFDGYDCVSTKNTVSSTALAGNITEWIGKGATNKHLPPFYLSGNKKFRLGLLAGLLDTDGTCGFRKAAAKKTDQFMAQYHTTSTRLATEVVELCRSLGIRATITEYAYGKDTKVAMVVNLSAVDVHTCDIKLRHNQKSKDLAYYKSTELSKLSIANSKSKYDLVPFNSALAKLTKNDIKVGSPDPEIKSVYTLIMKYYKHGYIPRDTAKKICSVCQMPKEWQDIVNSDKVSWVKVTEVTALQNKVTMYDITAPGPYTFMTSSGIIVQDTMGVFVPISHKAVEEAKNFLPTRVLEHAADNKIMLAPGHDVMTGMYYLTRSGKDLSKRKYATLDDAMKDYKTKTIEMYDTVTINGQQTTIGKTLVNQIMPEGMSIPTGGLTKSTMGGFLKDLSKKGPDVFRDTMDKLSKLATKYNIYSSISIGLEDITPDYKNREAALKEVVRDYNKATDDNERRKVLQKNVKIMDTVARNFAANNPENAIAQLLTASGKPSFDQFKQMVITPFAVSDELGRAVPFPLTHSFPEGLPISEYWAHTYGSRSGMIQKRLATADPGYFAKQVISATTDNVISKEDCGTKEGVETSLDSSLDVIGRYEAGTNKLIDEAQYRALTKAGKKSIKLRSPLTCELKEGTCSACYGLRENGQKAKIGDNVGALAGQFITEPTTQGSMKAFHTGAVLGSGAQVAGGLERLQQLTLVPKFLKDKATLAAVSGKVEHIEDNPGGGKNIYVNGEKHLMGVRNVLKVKVGDKVDKGDALTDGPVKPQELLALKGIGATQKYLVDNMQETLKDMGRPINRKLLETVVRSTTNLTTVEDPGNHPYYVPGDKAPLTEILSWNKNANNEVDTNEALGAHLAVAAGPYAAGTLLDKDKIKALSTLGIDKVVVKSSPIKHTPSIVGINILARMSKDWLAKLNTDHIEQMVLDSVQEGAVAPTSSYNPTGAYVLATNFGKGKDGKY